MLTSQESSSHTIRPSSKAIVVPMRIRSITSAAFGSNEFAFRTERVS